MVPDREFGAYKTNQSYLNDTGIFAMLLTRPNAALQRLG